MFEREDRNTEQIVVARLCSYQPWTLLWNRCRVRSFYFSSFVSYRNGKREEVLGGRGGMEDVVNLKRTCSCNYLNS